MCYTELQLPTASNVYIRGAKVSCVVCDLLELEIKKKKYVVGWMLQTGLYAR